MPRKTISLRLDPELLERVDALASERGVRRTVVIEEALALIVTPSQELRTMADAEIERVIRFRNE